MKNAMIALVAAATLTPATLAATTNPFASDSAVLNLRNLDLATPDGQRRLAIRMDQAARSVCGDRVASIHLALDVQSRACRSDVVANIKARIEQRSASATTAQRPQQLALR